MNDFSQRDLRSVAVIAPFWGQRGHVGNNRVGRFVRWLSCAGYSVVLVRAGSIDKVLEVSWGVEISVRDPFGFYPDDSGSGDLSGGIFVKRKPNRLRRAVALWLFNPDPTVVWSKMVAASSEVNKIICGCSLIVSSSPPESGHVAGLALSKKFNIPHVVDLRDGWLDEPLKPNLVSSSFRRWREGRLEREVVSHAGLVFVTSEVWRELLCRRYSGIDEKVCVVPNGYPEINDLLVERKSDPSESGKTVLLHAGRFMGSRSTQRASILLEKLFGHLSRYGAGPGVVRMIGALTGEDVRDIEFVRSDFLRIGWELEVFQNMPRDAILREMQCADGLLLLSASMAAIPSKLFEYIASMRPIFVVTLRDSAVWSLSKKLPQAVVVDDAKNDYGDEYFLGRVVELPGAVPYEFSDGALSERFLSLISTQCDG